MSNYPSGILAYGYDLGGPDHWKLNKPEPNEYGYVNKNTFVFMQPFEGAESLEDSWFAKRAIDFLLMKSGFKLYQWFDSEGRPSNYSAKKNDAILSLGLSVVTYGSSDYKGYILAMSSTYFTAPEYGAREVHPNLIDHSAADRLYAALETLEIDPIQAEPRWILASYYG